jgi:hypothetical protein
MFSSCVLDVLIFNIHLSCSVLSCQHIFSWETNYNIHIVGKIEGNKIDTIASQKFLVISIF